MAKGSLNIKVNKQDFANRINELDIRIAALMDVIGRYENAKKNMSQFIGDTDSNYADVLAQIEYNIKTARAAHEHLKEARAELQTTVDKMENMGKEVGQTIKDAFEAAKSTTEAVMRVDAIL